MWYTLIVEQYLPQGIFAIEDERVSNAWDNILDELLKNNKIEIY
jgi:hypothetical protein